MKKNVFSAIKTFKDKTKKNKRDLRFEKIAQHFLVVETENNCVWFHGAHSGDPNQVLDATSDGWRHSDLSKCFYLLTNIQIKYKMFVFRMLGNIYYITFK